MYSFSWDAPAHLSYTCISSADHSLKKLVRKTENNRFTCVFYGFEFCLSHPIINYTLRLQTFRLQTFRLLLYTSLQDSYTSNFCFSKSLFSSVPTSTYTTIPFINPTSTDTMIIQHTCTCI